MNILGLKLEYIKSFWGRSKEDKKVLAMEQLSNYVKSFVYFIYIFPINREGKNIC